MPPNEHPFFGGMGEPTEDPFYFGGYRDPGQAEPPVPKDVVFDPSTEVPGQTGATREQQLFLKEFFARFKDFVGRVPILTKRPAFVEAPYFAKPRVKVNALTIPFTASPATLVLEYKVPDRTRLEVTAVGIEPNPLAAYTNHNLLMWFALADRAGQPGDVIPFFDDQSAFASAKAGFKEGKTTILPGSCSQPFNVFSLGTPLRITTKGDKFLQFWAQNFDTADTTLCALITFFEYWLPHSAEFEKADNQI